MLISVVKMKVKIDEKKVSLDFCKLLPKEFWEERKKFFFWNCGPGHFQAEFASSGCILSTTLCFFALTVMKLISSRHWCNEASLYCRLKARCSQWTRYWFAIKPYCIYELVKGLPFNHSVIIYFFFCIELNKLQFLTEW